MPVRHAGASYELRSQSRFMRRRGKMLTPNSVLPNFGALVCAFLMSIFILRAIALGDGSAQLANLLAMPWGQVSLVDLYVGFSLFSGWIWFREQNTVVAVAWTCAMMCLGFAAGSVYVLLALRQCRGDWTRFWMGARSSEAGREGRLPASVTPLLDD